MQIVLCEQVFRINNARVISVQCQGPRVLRGDSVPQGLPSQEHGDDSQMIFSQLGAVQDVFIP